MASVGKSSLSLSSQPHHQLGSDTAWTTPSWHVKGQRYANITLPMEYPSMALPMRGPIPTVFRGSFQHGFLSIFYSVGQGPLDMWDKQLRSGNLKRILDYEIRSQSLELVSNNVLSTFITTPPGQTQSLGVRLPIMVMVVKNLRRYFLFEVQIVDDTNTRRRFRISNFNVGIKVRPFLAVMSLKMEEGWNQVILNIGDLCRKVFGTGFVEVLRVQIHANCRLRRIYFCERIASEEDIPLDFKSFVMSSANPGSLSEANSRLSTRHKVGPTHRSLPLNY